MSTKQFDLIRDILTKKFGSDGQKKTEALDEIVHSLASQLASAVNNGGLDCQIEFIIEQCGDLAEKTVAEDIG